jgi:hypothetical protein
MIRQVEATDNKENYVGKCHKLADKVGLKQVQRFTLVAVLS